MSYVITESNDFIRLINTRENILLYIYSNGCSVCSRKASPVYDTIAENFPHVTFSSLEYTHFSALMGKVASPNAVPCYVFIKNGEEVYRIVGFDRQKLEDSIRRVF